MFGVEWQVNRFIGFASGSVGMPLLLSLLRGDSVGATDFHLQSTSPCRGTGLGGSDLGAFPFLPGAVDHISVSPATGATTAGATQ